MNFNDLPYIPNWRDEVEEKVQDYRKRQVEAEKQAQNDVYEIFMTPGKNPHLRVRPKVNVPLGNDWVTEIEQNETISIENQAILHHRRIIPTFYTWDEYRIYLHVIRQVADYDAIVNVIKKQGPLITDGIIILSVFEGTDHIIPFKRDHLNLEENIFFVCVPESFSITVESDSEYIPAFNLQLSPLETVHDLKESIHRRRGFPCNRFDLIYDGTCMEDEERLLHYDLRNKSKVEMIMQTGLRKQIQIFSFWERVYYLEIDYTTTASEIIEMVIRKCATSEVETMQIRENYVNAHHIILSSDSGKTIGYNNCVHSLLQEAGSDRLIMGQRTNTVDEFLLHVDGLEHGPETVKVTNGGKYLAAYLQLHGISDIPVNRLMLLGKDKTLNPYDVVNIERDGTHARVIVSHRRDDDPKLKFTVNAILPTGVLHTVALKGAATVNDIKYELFKFGYEEVLHYSVWYKNRELRDSTILNHIKVKHKDFVHVLPTQYPIFIINPKNMKEKMKVHIKGGVDKIIEIGNKTFPAANGRPKYIFCGKQIRKTGATIEDYGICPSNKIYQDSFEDEIVLEIHMTARDATQVVLKRNSIGFRLREGLAHYRLPRHIMDALEQLVIWRVTKPSPTEVISHKGNSMDDAFYAETALKLSGLLAPPHDPSTGLPQSRKAVPQRFLINDRKVPLPKYTHITLPPLILRARPTVINYDPEEGIHSLLNH